VLDELCGPIGPGSIPDPEGTRTRTTSTEVQRLRPSPSIVRSEDGSFRFDFTRDVVDRHRDFQIRCNTGHQRSVAPRQHARRTPIRDPEVLRTQ